MFYKKSLGQHFLRSEKALTSIISAAELTSGDTVLEIGPGEGVLTERLLTEAGKVIAVEKDDNLYETLQRKFTDEIASKKLELVHEDILEFNPRGKYKLVANIPYNITGEIFRKFLSSDSQPSLMVLLIQKEVAERIVARDGKESILSISVKVYGKPEYIERVLAGSFVPAPRVDSAILKVGGISKDFFKGFTETDFFTLLKTGFKSKRKKLSSNLASIYPREWVEKAFLDLNLDHNTRAEDINLDQWRELAHKML
jgi:16S rRNA (adenine1518-N6/adenine1519-N6)-dimethyltransferase